MTAIDFFKKPPLLAAVTFLTGLLIVVLGLIASYFSPLPDHTVFVWGIFVAMILIYIIFNTVFSFVVQSTPGYWAASIYSFLGLGVACILASWAFTGLSIYEMNGFRSVLSILGIGYTVFLGIGFSIKRITDLTMRRDSEKLKRDSDEIGHNLQ
nr:hypothetical protein [Saprospiraceae bacterium]